MEPAPPVSRNSYVTANVLVYVNWLWIYCTFSIFSTLLGAALPVQIVVSTLIGFGLVLWKNRKMNEIDERDKSL